MVTCTQAITAALDEATAIVEAEWMRLQQQGAASVDDHDAQPKGAPAPQVRPPGLALGVACVRRPGPPSITSAGCQPICREARLEIWATERSPPGGSVISERKDWR
jgi:hypothetical protein